jgi:prevent-host-death family protein
MKRIAAFEARNVLADILNRVAYAKERVILTRHDKDVAALISIEDLKLLESLAEAGKRKTRKEA